MHIFIIILNWNGSKDTIECLKSIKDIPSGEFLITIVLVDNNSKTADKDFLKEYIDRNKDLDIRLLENKDNLGYAGGNNVGIKYAVNNEADGVIILNNDTGVHPKLIQELVRCAESNKKAGIITPKIFFHPGYEFHKDRYSKRDFGKVIWSAGGVIDWNNVFGENRGLDEVDTGQYSDSASVDFATGACMYLKPDFIEENGMFDERYFMYFEDADLSVRAKRAGWEIVYCPKAMVWHKVGQSAVVGSALSDYFISRNRLLFGLKYAPLRTKVSLVKQALQFIVNGRPWQKKGVLDFVKGRFDIGSWNKNK